MRALFILFIFGYILSAQNSDIYKRPFQSKPDFDIDVLHYDINLKINDHEKTFYGKTIIIKYGGSIMLDEAKKNLFAANHQFSLRHFPKHSAHLIQK